MYLYVYKYTCTLTICIHINDLKHFSNLQILKESQSISDCDLEVHINHLNKLREYFKIILGDLDNMHVPE